MSDTKDCEDRARDAASSAYAPYSNYQVGACVRVRGSEKLYSGSNVENATYGLSICAERSAIVKAANDGHRDIDLVMVFTKSSPPAAPCGMCRQTINEFTSSSNDTRIVLFNDQGERREFTLEELFPAGFRGEDIPK